MVFESSSKRIRYYAFFFLVFVSFAVTVVCVMASTWNICELYPVRDPQIQYVCMASDSEFLIGKRLDEPLVQNLIKNHNHVVSLNKLANSNTNGLGATVLYVNKTGIIAEVGCIQ